MDSKSIFKFDLESPIGALRITADSTAIVSINFMNPGEIIFSETNTVIDECKKQLKEYFRGTLFAFDLPLAPEGSDFQKKVWEVLLEIPFGGTTSYEKIAVKLGDRNSVRAVGNANGKNPIPIIIPCHRVVGKNNSLTGYAGGLKRKQWLLSHEHFFSNLEKQLEFFPGDKIEFEI